MDSFLQKRFRWAPELDSRVKELWTLKAQDRMSDTFRKERNKALKKAADDHPGQPPMDFLHEYAPWWASPEIWRGLCATWRSEPHLQKSAVYSQNRRSSATPGEKAKGTWKGGSRIQSRWRDVMVNIFNTCSFLFSLF